MSPIHIHHGMNLRDALIAAEELGLRVVKVNRTGETDVLGCIAGVRRKRVRVNRRRKDAPRQLTNFLLKVKEKR
jgi:hypothetical protein